LNYGKSLSVNIGLAEGAWEKFAGGQRWRLHLRSVGAKSLNFIFSEFYLPPGANLRLYTPDSSMVMGPITPEMLREDGKFFTDLLAGESTILELYEPNTVQGQSKIAIDRVVHGFVEQFKLRPDNTRSENNEDFNTSLSCQRNVLCEGAFTNESEGVILCTTTSRRYSTSLVQNTGNMTSVNSFRPYVLEFL
jgi:lysyl endopeptidase